ncbi:flagellar biosynthesis anti-sigma factor FlgM [Pseudomonadota bacterium]|nr:flagellar biosynthesis anti-sigma factor FlgM [Pseudomonadota bacterium]
MSDISNIKVGNIAGLTTPTSINSRENKQQEQAIGIQAAGKGTDKISLTETATQLQSVKQTLADAPIVNDERVSELRAAVADGSYSVDATELAQNIIDFENKLL